MLNFLRKIFKPRYETLNKIIIHADKIIANFDYLKSLQPQAEIFPVLKSNAYGHGLKEICQILNRTKVLMVAVDSYPEAQVVYRYFRGRVLILGEMPHRAYRYCRFKRTEFVVYNEDTLRHLSRFAKKAKVHLFVNSGMNREGIKDFDAWLSRNKKYLERVEVSGLCSHLASADEESILNQAQEDNFVAALEILRKQGIFPRWVHLGNSAAIFSQRNNLLTAYRPGLALYGYSPFLTEENENTQLQPALEIFSHVISLQDLEAGESVSYNEDYRVSRSTRIAVIPFGYFEGLDRRLSNKAQFLVQSSEKSFWSRVAGRVCMNLSCLDIGEREVRIGDLVQIVSSQKKDPNSVVNLSLAMSTIPYEFLVKLQPSIRREIL